MGAPKKAIKLKEWANVIPNDAAVTIKDMSEMFDGLSDGGIKDRVRRGLFPSHDYTATKRRRITRMWKMSAIRKYIADASDL
jgi:hypothetical protein